MTTDALMAAYNYDEFVPANSGARYLGVAAALIVGVFVVDSAGAAFTALTARLVMDLGDVVAGVRTDQFDSVALGIAQSAADVPRAVRDLDRLALEGSTLDPLFGGWRA